MGGSEVLVQGKSTGSEGDVFEWNFFRRKEACFQRFRADVELRAFHLGEEYHIHLPDLGDVVDGLEVKNLDFGTRLLAGLPQRPFFEGLPVFQVASRQIPIARSWFDGPSAKQYFVFPDGKAADDHLGILVVDGLTVGANVAGAIIPFGDIKNKFGASTLAAIIHKIGLHIKIQKYQNH